jgi:hypothetical protein
MQAFDFIDLGVCFDVFCRRISRRSLALFTSRREAVKQSSAKTHNIVPNIQIRTNLSAVSVTRLAASAGNPSSFAPASAISTSAVPDWAAEGARPSVDPTLARAL